MIIISLARLATDEPRQALRAAAAGDDAEQDLRLAEHGPLAGDAVVARQRQLAPAAERVAADRGDDEPRDRGDGVERGVEAGGDRLGLARPAELADVGAGREDPLATGDHDGAGRVGGQVVGRRAQLGEQLLRQRVHLRVVQRDDGNAVVTSLHQHQFSHAVTLRAEPVPPRSPIPRLPLGAL